MSFHRRVGKHSGGVPSTARPVHNSVACDWNDFRITRLLGEGVYGMVHEAIHLPTNSRVAVKRSRIDKSDGLPPSLLREIGILRDLVHPNIVELKHVCMHENKYLAMVCELCDEDLGSFLRAHRMMSTPKHVGFKERLTAGGLPLEMVKHLLRDLLCGLAFCHSQRIIHRDIKPQNLLLCHDPTNHSTTLKLADFGLSRLLSLGQSFTPNMVTLWYRAPEVLLGAGYAQPVDLWSVGCVLAELVTGEALFKGESQIEQLFSIFRVLGTPNEQVWPGVTKLPYYKFTFPKWRNGIGADLISGLGNSGLDLLCRLLCYDPASRITARQALNHPFLLRKSDVQVSSPSSPMTVASSPASYQTDTSDDSGDISPL